MYHPPTSLDTIYRISFNELGQLQIHVLANACLTFSQESQIKLHDFLHSSQQHLTLEGYRFAWSPRRYWMTIYRDEQSYPLSAEAVEKLCTILDQAIARMEDTYADEQ